MSAPEILEPLVGSWSGSSTLSRPWLTPPETQSASTATVDRVAGGRFVSLRYTWEVDGARQEGMLLVGFDPKAGEATAAWADSWHMGDQMMVCKGSADRGAVRVMGWYAAPPGPDWGWRTEIHPADSGWELVMYNVSPDGEESLAFRNRYQRP